MTEPAIAAATYARWRPTTRGAITGRVETRVVFDLAGPLAERRVLDLGTGDGTYAIDAAARSSPRRMSILTCSRLCECAQPIAV